MPCGRKWCVTGNRCLRYFTAALFISSQHASSDVEKMVLGNKCDMTDRRQVSKDRGEKVRDGLSRIKSLAGFSGSRFTSVSRSWPSIME